MMGTWPNSEASSAPLPNTIWIEETLCTQERILVSGGRNLKPLGFRVVSQPSPTGTLDGSSSSVELLLEGVQSVEVAIDSLFQRTRSELSAPGARGGEVLPEQGVVDVACKTEKRGDRQ